MADSAGFPWSSIHKHTIHCSEKTTNWLQSTKQKVYATTQMQTILGAKPEVFNTRKETKASVCCLLLYLTCLLADYSFQLIECHKMSQPPLVERPSVESALLKQNILMLMLKDMNTVFYLSHKLSS